MSVFIEGCKYCEDCKASGDDRMPPHFAKLSCKSGGREHCTCDTCY